MGHLAAAYETELSLAAELFNAAQEVDSLSSGPLKALLLRAAWSVAEKRAEIALLTSDKEMPPGAVVSDLLTVAEALEACSREEVALALLRAAYVLKTFESMAEGELDSSEGRA